VINMGFMPFLEREVFAIIKNNFSNG